MTAALELDGIDAGYGRTAVLRNVSLAVPTGGAVALLGANGAGKTTLMRVAAGLLAPSAGTVSVGGEVMAGHKAYRTARRGLCLVPEGRGIYRSLTVKENLLVFGGGADARDELLDRFPVLRQRLKQPAGTLSGGEQQMLALARAYVTRPELVLLDEVSMGLSPVLVEQIFTSLHDLRARGVALLVVEQYVQHALAIADHVYVLARGQVVLSGPPEELDHELLARTYTG